ncbi:MAG TPA: polyphosphate kinase 2 family protein [Terriglobia bacterium]|nr:polyphosphate kinase 2 family protein [Terriglobia bacterium]
MNLKEIAEKCRKLASPYRIDDGRKFRLDAMNPGDVGDLTAEDKPRAKEALALGVQALAELQGLLYAQDQWGALVIFQAMDAAGKDGAIKHVMSGINPQGCQVDSFKAPSAEELDHDYLWRCLKRLPERGRIGIFNRSYYEEVLVLRVHEELLRKQKVPAELITPKIWEERYEDIRNVEQYLSRNGYVIRKIFLNVSREEQKRRFMERLETPDKHWKFSASDAQERQHWNAYMTAYEAMIQATARPYAPWYVVPADNKWFTRVVVAATIIDALEALDLKFPEMTDAQKQKLGEARKALVGA